MGEQVKIRFLVLDPKLRPPNGHKVNTKYFEFITLLLNCVILQIPRATLYNPFGNTIAVWNNIPTELGLAQEVFQLAEDTTVVRIKIFGSHLSNLLDVVDNIVLYQKKQ